MNTKTKFILKIFTVYYNFLLDSVKIIFKKRKINEEQIKSKAEQSQKYIGNRKSIRETKSVCNQITTTKKILLNWHHF